MRVPGAVQLKLRLRLYACCLVKDELWFTRWAPHRAESLLYGVPVIISPVSIYLRTCLTTLRIASQLKSTKQNNQAILSWFRSTGVRTGAMKFPASKSACSSID